MKAVILIILASVWLALEGLLILRDRSHAKGSTREDQRSLRYNTLATFTVLIAPLPLSFVSVINFSHRDIFTLTCVGTLLACLGVLLRHWSIHVLGKYFRTTVEIEEGQPIIQTGPYRLVRHPSYSGMLLFFLGYGVLSQNWGVLLLSLLLPAAVLRYRIGVEERLLALRAGQRYRDYQKKTKKLIPGIW